MKEDDDIIKPDLAYVRKVLKRQAFPAMVLGGVTLICGILATLNTENVYRSTSSVVVDNRDLYGDPFAGKSWALAAQRNFRLKFTSQDFLDRVIREANIKPSSSKWLGSSASSDQSATKNDLDRESKYKLIANLKDSIMTSNDRGDGALTLYVDWNSPEEAQRIASQAMDIWIVSEIEDEKAQLQSKLETLILNKQLKSDQEEIEKKQINKPRAAAEDDLSYAKRTAQISQDIQELEDQLTAENSQIRRRRVDLEVDLERLRSKFLPTHPDIQSRENELGSVHNSMQSIQKINEEIEQKRAELLRVKMQNSLNLEPTMGGIKSNIPITAQISQLQIAIKNLEQQIIRPDQRTRYQVIGAATYESEAIKKRKRGVAIASLALSLIFAFALAIYREFSNPLARDSWRVQFSSRLPVWGQIASRTLESHPLINVKIADEMRSSLGKDSAITSSQRALLGYRQIEIALRKRAQGKSILMIEGSTKSDLRGFYVSLFNIVASDMAGRVLVIDANQVSPLRDAATSHGFLTVLQAHADQNTKIDLNKQTSNSEQPYDFLNAYETPKGPQTRLFQEKYLKPFISYLEAVYDLILIRGLPETHFLENSAFATSCSDTLMIVDAHHTTLSEINRSSDQLGENTIKGVVLVGS